MSFRFLVVILSVLETQAEWRRTVTQFSFKNPYYNDNLTNSIYFTGSPHVDYYMTFQEQIPGTDRERFRKGRQYVLLNESVPVRFMDMEYYWNDTFMPTGTLQICEYRISGFEGGLSTTYKNTSSGEKVHLEAIFYSCGLFETCDGLLCAPLSWTKILVISGLLILGLSALIIGLLAYRKCRIHERRAREKSRNEMENREMGTCETVA